MISLEEVQEMLDDIASEFPKEFYQDLNGGIVLLPEVKMNTMGKKNDLFILGEYHRSGTMGRFISIYYGSFIRVHGHLNNERMKEQLRHTLKHEFTHHLESLAGERGLEIKDAKFLDDYMKRNKREIY